MSADEIKGLAQQAFVDAMADRNTGLFKKEARCKQYANALLEFAEMVERCEEVINGKFDGEIRDIWGVGDVYTSDTVMKMQNYILKGATDGTKH